MDIKTRAGERAVIEPTMSDEYGPYETGEQLIKPAAAAPSLGEQRKTTSLFWGVGIAAFMVGLVLFSPKKKKKRR